MATILAFLGQSLPWVLIIIYAANKFLSKSPSSGGDSGSGDMDTDDGDFDFD